MICIPHISDELSRLEAIANFINVACVALSSLEESNLSATVTPKTWEGLGVLVSEMEDKKGGVLPRLFA